jgi:dihydropyrimidinase
MAKLFIRNGEIITSMDRMRGDVYCEDGVIRAVGAKLEVPAGTEVIDASGQLVFPGGLDPHVHMELPFMGTVSADDFESGTAAGICGGVTCIIDFCIPAAKQRWPISLITWPLRGSASKWKKKWAS